ncbi:hypothetical protein [Alkaliphilus oremlandii]|uniref:Uncharacterized protein n=1 Tax=Alkaliphilus oremlandii (strain OhILAs) TaxID=350688 RepID=A8MLR8_ALKOO|nr:hypothetical protein [Alkaliphilus oremlandii]ABW17985.1 hypothetical protein Clos_0423 [Alkaliphilus oremlandii OhILAs]
MFWRYNSTVKLRELEDKNLLKLESENLKNRAGMEPTRTLKQSVRMILIGIFFAITLTAFEYALKNFEISDFLRKVFQFGFFGSLVGILSVPYGLYHLIKSLK